jgi:uncharacterized protein involved in propanediol utilization
MSMQRPGTLDSRAGVAPHWSGAGHGTAVGHHGELLQGVFQDGDGLRRGLVTMPFPSATSRAEARLTTDTPHLRVEPTWKVKALRAARATIEALGAGPVGGVVTVHGTSEVGLGFGTSTSDVTATIRAVADALSGKLTEARIARIAVLAETAADPLMYDRMVLFAHRDGCVIEDFAVPMCPFEALGFAVRAEPVHTLALTPARYRPEQITRLARLRRLCQAGLVAGDLATLGAVATESALINQEFLPSSYFPRLREIVRNTGATGIQIAHSGSIASILFQPADPRVERRIGHAEQELAKVGIVETWRFGNTG